MKKISKKIFEPYLYEPDSIRPVLEKPFANGDYIVATDSHILLRIRKDLVEGEFDSPKYPPNVQRAIPEPNCSLTLSAQDLSAALQSLDREEEMVAIRPEIECPEYHGDGEVEWEYEDKDYITHTDWFKCPCCDGSGILSKAEFRPTGRMRVSHSAAIIINGAFLWASQLETLLDTIQLLGVNEVQILSLTPGKACRVSITEGIDFLAMTSTPDVHNAATSVYHLNLKPNDS